MNRGPGLRVVITGGGTGGHLFPGIAVAQEIKRRFSEAEILFVGTGRLVDQQAMSQYGFEVQAIHCGVLKGGGIIRKVKTLGSLPFSLLEAIRLLRAFKPDLVFGVGGYVTGPVVLAARFIRIATAIHEQNSVPGLANRWLSLFAKRIFLSIPGSEKYFNAAKCSFSGNPVRQDIIEAGRSRQVSDPVLLVLGGSQGAHSVNALVPEAVQMVHDQLPAGFRVIHQTGNADEELVRLAYAKAGVQALVAAFFPEMAAVYRQARLVISRAGATTLAELAILQQAAILIPFPYAADDHQRKNADCLVREGAAMMFSEGEVTPEKLGREILRLMIDDSLCTTMGERAGSMAKPRAAATIVDECLQMIGY